MKNQRQIVMLASVLVALTVAGCAPPMQTSEAPNNQAFTERKTKATALSRKGDLAGALIEWRVLEALTEQDAKIVRQRRKVETEIARRATAKFDAGAKAAADGSPKTARRHYLAVLAIDPNHLGAIDELRKIELVRVRRARPKQVASKPSRTVAAAEPAKISRLAAATTPKTAELRTKAASPETWSAALEKAVALAKQGDHDRAIGQFEAHLRQHPGDTKARAQLSSSHRAVGFALYLEGKLEQSVVHLETLADVGPKDPVRARILTDAKRRLAQQAYEMGIRVFRKDVGQAIAYWQKSLTYDPGHIKARSQLVKAYKIEETLKSIKQ